MDLKFSYPLIRSVSDALYSNLLQNTLFQAASIADTAVNYVTNRDV